MIELIVLRATVTGFAQSREAPASKKDKKDRPSEKIPRTLQIATFGGDSQAILVGIRNVPAHKVALLSSEQHKEAASRLRVELTNLFQLPVDTYFIRGQYNIAGMVSVIEEILLKDKENFDDIVVNVSGGDKHLSCAATSAAFIFGLKAIDCIGDTCMMLPVIRLRYERLLSKAKVDILKALIQAEGQVDDLEELGRMTGYGKPLLSHHLRGSDESVGLEDLGLVELERWTRGKLRIRLTQIGRIAALTTPAPPETET